MRIHLPSISPRWLYPVLSLLTLPANAQQASDELIINSATYQIGGEELGAAREQGQMEKFFLLEKELVYQILGQAGIDPQKLDPAVKENLDRFFTTDLAAFEQFCQCLDLMDNQRFKEAEAACNSAVERDPDFKLAKSLLDTIPPDQTDLAKIAENITRQEKNNPNPPPILAAFTPTPGPGAVPGNPADLQPSGKSPTVLPADNPYNLPQPDQIPVNTLREAQEAGLDRTPPDNGGGTPPDNGGGGTPPDNGGGTPPVDCTGGTCGLYSTFLSRRAVNSENIEQGTRPFNTPTAQSLSGNGIVRLQQQGSPDGFVLGQGFNGNQPKIVAFQDGEFGDGNDTINVDLTRVVTNTFLDGQLQLGVYETGFDFGDAWTDSSGRFNYDFSHAWIYFVEGTVTPQATIAEFIANNQSFDYAGIAGGDLTVDDALTFCLACGRVSGTLNYGNQQVNNFRLDIATSGAAASIRADGVPLNERGEFQFNQENGQFAVGTNLNNATSPAQGNVAGRNFGANAEAVGGVYNIAGQTSQGSTIIGHGNFIGTRVIDSLPQ